MLTMISDNDIFKSSIASVRCKLDVNVDNKSNDNEKIETNKTAADNFIQTREMGKSDKVESVLVLHDSIENDLENIDTTATVEHSNNTHLHIQDVFEQNNDNDVKEENKNIQNLLKTKEVRRPFHNHPLLAINISIKPDKSDSAISAFIKERASRALQSLKAESEANATEVKDNVADNKVIKEEVNTNIKIPESQNEMDDSNKIELKNQQNRVHPLLALNINITPDKDDHAISAFIKQRAARALRAIKLDSQTKSYKRPQNVIKPFRIVDVNTPVSANVANRLSSKVLKSSDLIDIYNDMNFGKIGYPALNMFSHICSRPCKSPRIINAYGMIMPYDIYNDDSDSKTMSNVTSLNSDSDEILKQRMPVEKSYNDENYSIYSPTAAAEATFSEAASGIDINVQRDNFTIDDSTRGSNMTFNDIVEEIERKSLIDSDTLESDIDSDITDNPKRDIASLDEPLTSAESGMGTVLFETRNAKEKYLQEKEKVKHSGKHSCSIV